MEYWTEDIRPARLNEQLNKYRTGYYGFDPAAILELLDKGAYAETEIYVEGGPNVYKKDAFLTETLRFVCEQMLAE